MEDILIDTDIVIDYLRATNRSASTLISLLQKNRLFISSITEFELFLGAKTNRHIADLELLFSEFNTLPFDFGCGRIAASLWKETQATHQHTEIKDIFIASIAIRNGIWLLTHNKKHFRFFTGVKLWDKAFSQ